MAITDKFIKSIKATGKAQKISLEENLYLHVNPKGNKFFRVRFSFGGKRNSISLGQYPYLSLAEARKQLFETKELLAKGINPSAHKKANKSTYRIESENTFIALACEWITLQEKSWSKGHAKRIRIALEKDLFPIIGKMPIKDITAQTLLNALQKVEKRGALDTAHRLLQNCGSIFRYAIRTGRLQIDISTSLRGVIAPAKSKHYASIKEPNAVGQLLRDIDDYNGNPIIQLALRISPYVFVRPGELRRATWDEFNFDTAEWHIPAERMKMRQIHIVPLSRQVIDLLKELWQYTGDGQYLFPSMRGRSRPISDGTLTVALRTMGYDKGKMTIHGFRSMASTLLNSQGYNRDWIERQLAHGESNSVRAAYNHADHLQDRKCMMQEWADYLDELRESGK